MVFESIVADLLNRTLGDYVENLDYKQLKLGIWGGDVVLHNLVLKPTALEDLNLPIKIAFGNLGKLVLKIPWKNLYNSPVEVSVEGLFLVLIPSQEARYDAEKEEKWFQEGKQAVLLKVEEAKKKALERESEDQTVKADTFAEKLITQILKNVQIKVQDIHIRYEDRITTPGHTFALGVTLHNLSIQTTNAKWEDTIITVAVNQFHKKLVLEGLGIYWNCNTNLYWTEGILDHEIKPVCKDGIYTKEHMPAGFRYMLGPINSVVKLIMAPKPEALQYKNPKILLNWELEDLSIGISKSQYRDLLGMLESFDRMTRGMPYRKYRPELTSYTGHARQWWKFAFTCVLEEEVRRVRQNWRWSRMQKHRARCKKYAHAYQAKLTAKKVTPEMLKEVADLERHLDVLNIILVRQKVEAEVTLDRKRRSTAGSEAGWFGGWFGGAAKPTEDPLTASAIAKKFENAMTTEEKAKLYRAIDYEENASAAEYPEWFVELSINFDLQALSIEVRDEIYDVPRVLYTELMGVRCSVETRPAGQATKVCAKMTKLTVFGMQQGKYIPKLVVSKELSGSVDLLNVLFETNPQDRTCDQRLHVTSRPLELIYDAGTINKISDVFKPPQQSRALNQLQAAATLRLKNFKELSAMGLQYAIDTHTILDLNVDLMSSYMVLPKRGIYTRNEDLLVVNLGRISMKSVMRDPRKSSTIRDLHSIGTSEDEILQHMMAQSYDKFIIKVHDMQVLVVINSENWKHILSDGKASPLHLLTPTSLTVNFDKCVITNDPRFPMLKIAAHLPSVAIAISDERLLRLLFLLMSIPFTSEEEFEIPLNTDAISVHSSASAFSKYELPMDLLNLKDPKPWKKIGPVKSTSIIGTGDATITQAVEMDLRFELPDLSITLYKLAAPGILKTSVSTPEHIKVFGCRLVQLELSYMKQTYDTQVVLRLGGVAIDVNDALSDVRILDTPMTAGQTEYLFTVIYNQVDKKSPDFRTVHKNIQQYVKVSFSTANVVLHQEALLTLMEFSQKFQEKLDMAENKPSTTANPPMRTTTLTFIPEEGSELHIKSSFIKKKRRAKHESNEVLFKFKAHLQDLKVHVVNRRTSLSDITISGCSTEMLFKHTHTQIIARLRNIVVLDNDPQTEHHKIVSILGDEVLRTKVVLYSDTTAPPTHKDPYPDVCVEAEVSCIRVVYLGKFVTSLLSFVNTFQTAKDKLMLAAAGAATAAKQNIQDAQLMRLKLDIKLQAPLFILPVHARSMDAIVLDFGRLTIINSLRYLRIEEKDDTAVIDEAVIGLHNLKISRVNLTSGFEAKNECALLQPVSFQVDFSHNLSAVWYHNIPGMSIEGTLHTVNITVTEEDVKMVMRVYNENIGPSEYQVEEVKSPEALAVAWNRSVATGELPAGPVPECDRDREKVALTSVNEVDEFSPEGISTESYPIAVQFKFSMDYLYIDLFNGGVKVLDDESLLQESATRTTLARFSIHSLSTSGSMFVDNMMTMALSVGNCLLEDTRAVNMGKLTRLMQRRPDSNPSAATVGDSKKADRSSNMMEVSYRMLQNNVIADMRVFSFDLILSLEYLMRLAEFAASGLATDEEKIESLAEVVSRTSKNSKTSVKNKQSKKSVASKTKSQANNAVKPIVEPIYTVNIVLEKPDIILVESMEDINTNCIIFNSELQMKLRLVGDRQVFSGSITHLQLYSCVYNPELRNDTKALILHPSSIYIAGSTPNNEGLHLDITLSPIKLGVSPGTIALLNQVYVTVFGSVAPASMKGQVEEEEDLSELWAQKQYEEADYWFLKPEVGTEAYVEPDAVPLPQPPQNEICVINAPNILITLEAGVGKQTLPMIMLEMKLDCIAHNWSSQLDIESTVTAKMSYYNSRLALWEPLIEPIEKFKNNKREVLPWELKLTAQINSVITPPPPADVTAVDGDIEEVPSMSPTVKMCVLSEENLELTVTKTSLNVFTTLGEAFQNAVSSNWQTSSVSRAPYVVKNHTGMSIVLVLENSPFQLYDIASASYGRAVLRSGSIVSLSLSETYEEETADITSGKLSADFQWESRSQFRERFLSIEMEPNISLRLPVTRADKRYFSLRQRSSGDGQEPWGLVSDVRVREGSTIITLRGILQVHNHFNVPVKVYYMTNRGNEVELIGTVKPEGDYNLPLDSIYTLTNEIFFGVYGYTVTVKPFIWKNLRNLLTTTELLQCEPKDVDNSEGGPFFMNVVGDTEQVYFEQTCRHTMISTVYNIHLRPTVIVRNLLPIDMTVGIEGAALPTFVLAGERILLPNAEPGVTKLIYEIPDYLEKDWSCTQALQVIPVPFSVCTFTSFSGIHRMTLDLGVHIEMQDGTAIMSVYCPFWMLNKTDIALAYRTDDASNILHHPGHYKGPILFSFKPKSFFGKKKASVKIADGDWSDRFSLDVAGSSGLVSCKGPSRTYQIGVHITLTASTLSKTVTFTPYFVLLNETTVEIEVQEGDRPADPWTKVKPDACTPLWPMASEKERDLRLRIVGTTEVSAHFTYNRVHTTLLKLDNKYGGINVDVQVTEASIYVTFNPYTLGFAPALLINHTNEPLVFWEKGMESRRRTLHPRELTLFTWQQPNGSRSLLWSVGKLQEVADELCKDGIGDFISEQDHYVYWVSFLDGMQRTLLFTQDANIAELAQSAGDLEQVDTEILISIHGFGLSLINNDMNVNAEILYIGVASSGVAWESRKGKNKRFKPLTLTDSAMIETAFQRYESEMMLDHTMRGKHTSRYLLANHFEVDFDTEEILKPMQRKIRRTFYMGLWVQLKMSSHQLQVHAKVNRLQIDNQLVDSIFPVMLAPVPPPKSVAAVNQVNRPFAELSIVRRIMEHSPVQQYKYFKFLVQEFHIKIDIGLINALVALFEAEEASEYEQAEHFRRDTLTMNEPLLAHVSMISSQEQANFYDFLHLSPLKIHLSFSLAAATGGQKPKQETPAFLNVLLQSLGVTLTDVQDVVFKLAFFERKFCFLSQKQLVSQSSSHYIGQAVKQLYVLVLGLDVLGNPYGLVVGLTQGVEDLFYEPFQGAIQGPGEFAEGLVLGVRSLFGHTVGGAAGAASRITGAMGKGIAALTFDKDYQRKRREALQQRPANVQQGLAQSGKGLVMGVVDGVSGVFTKPISGARQDGVAGFFTGMGKGVVGLVTRPTAGVIDFASGSLDAVKRATEMNEEVFRLRLPRFFHPDGLVRPYSAIDAEGNKLLQDVEKGRFIPTDIYSFHLALTDSGKDVLLLTDKRVMYLTHNDMFGKSLSWSCVWDRMKILPKVESNGIVITIPSDSKAKVLGLFSAGDSTKLIPIKNRELQILILNKMHQLMNI